VIALDGEAVRTPTMLGEPLLHDTASVEADVGRGVTRCLHLVHRRVTAFTLGHQSGEVPICASSA
jgi:hypothetical protein